KMDFYAAGGLIPVRCAVISGAIEIHLDNAVVTGQLFPSGHSNAKAKDAVLYITGNTTLTNTGKSSTSILTDGLTVHVGDGHGETHAKIGSLYESVVNLVKVY
ncbi:hypothetical protein P0G10_19895, partial [Eubacteriales bacterium DFI.9.88]|nr:hypothetical protein [Eubacteriales bacterium DFI.9.88]